MNFLKKVKGVGSSCAVRFNAKLAALCVFLLALASQAQAATDYTALGTAVSDNLTSVGTVLMTIAGVIVGVVVIITAFRFVRRMLG